MDLLVSVRCFYHQTSSGLCTMFLSPNIFWSPYNVCITKHLLDSVQCLYQCIIKHHLVSVQCVYHQTSSGPRKMFVEQCSSPIIKHLLVPVQSMYQQTEKYELEKFSHIRKFHCNWMYFSVHQFSFYCSADKANT